MMSPRYSGSNGSSHKLLLRRLLLMIKGFFRLLRFQVFLGCFVSQQVHLIRIRSCVQEFLMVGLKPASEV